MVFLKIKKTKKAIKGNMYYMINIKKIGLFSKWRKEFGSFNKREADKVYREISNAENVFAE